MLGAWHADLCGRSTVDQHEDDHFGVALSVLVSFFVWISVLATQTSQRAGDRTLHLSGLPPAK